MGGLSKHVEEGLVQNGSMQVGCMLAQGASWSLLVGNNGSSWQLGSRCKWEGMRAGPRGRRKKKHLGPM